MASRVRLAGSALAWLGLAAGPAMAPGQTPRGSIDEFHHTGWVTGRDLPATDLAGLARTPDGFVWLGSNQGLIRFDGARFTFSEGEEAAGGADGGVAARPLLLDDAGILWVARSDGALLRYRMGRTEVALPPGSVPENPTAMVQDRAGDRWLLASGRLHRWQNGSLLAAELPPEVMGSRIVGVAAHRAGGLWIGTASEGLWHVTDGRGRLEPHPHPPENPLVVPLVHDRKGRLWIAADGLQFLEDHQWRRPLMDGAPIPVTTAVEGPDDDIWLTSSGLGLIRWSAGTLQRFTSSHGLTHAAPGKVVADAEGTIWAVSSRGLDRLRPMPFQTHSPERGGMPDPLAVVPDPGGGLWAMDFSRRIHRLDGGPFRPGGGPETGVERPGTEDVFLGPAPGGGVWIYRLHGDRVARLTDRGEEVVRSSPELAWTGPRQGFEDRSGALWLGAAQGGFGRVRDGTYRSVPLPGLGPAPPIASMTADARGSVWVSVLGTPTLFQIRQDRVVATHAAASGMEETLLNLALETGDTLWASTPSGALARVVDGRVATVVQEEVQEALRGEEAVLVTAAGFLWVGSSVGIGRIALAELHRAADGAGPAPPARWFGPLDGLTASRTIRHHPVPGFRAADGRIWFSTPDGLAVVDPEAVPVNSAPPTPRVDQVVVSGRAGTIEDGGTVDPNPDRLEVRITAGTLRMPERALLEYRLEGADPEWMPADRSRMIVYSRLRPGDYTFRVRANNEDGIASVEDGSLSFRVRPAWYQAWWFLPLLVVGLAGIGVGGAGVRARAVSRAEARRLRDQFETTLAERSRMAQELHDTLLQEFVGVTLHLQVVERSVAQTSPQDARALSRILSMADHALREGRTMVWDMRSPDLDGDDLPGAVAAAAHRLVDGLPIRLDVTRTGEHQPLPPLLETTVLRVAREAVANAVRHGRPGVIRVDLIYQPDSVALRVSDDGTGFEVDLASRPADPEGRWGLHGMTERVHRSGGHLEIHSAPGQGTLVMLSIPLPESGPIR